MSPTSPLRRPTGALSLALSALALLVALSGTAYAAVLAEGSVHTKQLARGAVTTPKLHKNAVTGVKVRNGSLRLSDLGGPETDQVTTTGSPITIAANDCRPIGVDLFNPAPAKILGAMVVGTITNPGGGAVVDNSGAVLPTLVTKTSQGGAIIHLVVCAGPSSQTIPTGSKVTWSLLRR